MSRLTIWFMCVTVILLLSPRPAGRLDYEPLPAEVAAERDAALKAWRVGMNGWQVQQFKGRWFNYADGQRAVTGRPARCCYMLYMLGSSTLVGAGMPDADTIPSIVQRSASGCVVNLGVWGATTMRMLYLTERLPLRAGDTVLWLVGTGDTLDLFRRGGSGICKVVYGWIYDLALSAMCETDPALYPSADQMAERADNVAGQIAVARARVESRGGVFLAALEPHLWSHPLREDEQALARRTLTHFRLPNAFGVYYAAMQDRLRRIPGVIDGTSWLDSARAEGRVVYIDFIHTTREGSFVIATYLARLHGTSLFLSRVGRLASCSGAICARTRGL